MTICDLSAWWGTGKGGFMDGYFLGFGTYMNSKSSITRFGKEVAKNPKALVDPGKRHHIIVQVLKDKVQMYVDGQKVLEYKDLEPPAKADRIGLYTYTAGCFDNVRVYSAE